MTDEFKDDARPKMEGHVLIRDPESGQVLLDKKNVEINKTPLTIQRSEKCLKNPKVNPNITST